ncbi:uncharacterized protein F23B12.7 [Teleopsis dalmanni]|uniref:uncharacterized protein F23B12.7 n=1 Tax=Teleopsis dalmanni TaxID=139649 RepID=UPI0018CE3E48|nr:uncharacterized protein F23B12.7 [Teleopsis dalmanni]
MPPARTVKIDMTVKPKKTVFDDEGEIVSAETASKKQKKKTFKNSDEQVEEEDSTDNVNDYGEDDYFVKRDKERKSQQKTTNADDPQTKWFNAFPQYASTDEDVDIKDNEQMTLYNMCKSSFDEEMPSYLKRNPSDARWLQTALHKGTAKDRANAGALLVTSNPLANLEALSTLINFTKLSNKSCVEVIGILTDLWKEVLLPPQRKLLSLQMRGADWKTIRKDTLLTKEQQRRIYAYWYFENELKDHYFEFLKNLQQGMQAGQENNKNHSIVCAAQLLAFAPEKEQMLLTMLINKLGDPVAKVASKALYHLTEVAHKHPNMCGVIVAEAEKLLFRNNISERAQHFALCFLASIASAGSADVSTKMVNICFALFKVLVQKGAVNNRTMQAILRCLQKAILEAKPNKSSNEILNKEMQDTVYRLVHLADIRISVQTLGLLLQLITIKTEKSDRFYNALYKKMLDMEVTNIGTKTAAQLLHIIHRAMHIDANVPRVQAFIKRLLQVALYVPSQVTAGCLIVIYKLLRARKELLNEENDEEGATIKLAQVAPDDEDLAKFDSDGEEKYEDVKLDESTNEGNVTKDEEEFIDAGEDVKSTQSSWHHAKVPNDNVEIKTKEINATKYDPYHRVPAFAGAEFTLRYELLLLREHFHPTVQVFADNILNQKRIDYYGDPLRDFGLPHFLERFAFKNPKKLDKQKAETPTLAHKRYLAYGARGKPVKSLTKQNCAEEEMYIFNFLENKRKQAAHMKQKKTGEKDGDDDDETLKGGDIDDDEFEDYLDGFFGKKAKAAAQAERAEEEELDFLKELGGEFKDEKKKKIKKKKSDDDEDDGAADIDADWGDDVAENDNDDLDGSDSDMSDDEDGSIDFDNDDDNDSMDDSNNGSEAEDDIDEMSVSGDDDIADNDDDDDDDDSSPPKSKKSRKQLHAMNEKNFAKTLKHSFDMNSLFAAADDFAELLEETGKTKGQGTANAVFNKDKSSNKQLKWEEKRRSNAKTYGKKGAKGPSANKKFAKKRKN